jgi:hypothetical protein
MANDPQDATGRSKPAQITAAPSTVHEPPQAEHAEPQPGPSALTAPADAGAQAPLEPAASPASDASAVEATAGPASAPAIGAAPSQPLPTVLLAGLQHATDEERVLMCVLRLLDRVISPGTLSPVERAFVAGAKMMFDQLSKECRTMLQRKPGDLIRSSAAPGQTPLSAGNVPAHGSPAANAGASKRPKKAK